ncbi:MAG: hypothetical protein OXH00_24645 [Candidatus Poribacteria bacterium]|nr:hypothetical protein [Candidatus Poribacteria bacterium]
MLRKHRQVLILLVGLLYIYSVCPLLCATFEQKFCHDVSQEMLSGDTGTRGTCCQNTKTDTAGEAGNPLESGKLCCATDLELVLPDIRDNIPEFRELIGQSLISILPISATLPVALEESFKTSSVPLVSTLFPGHPLTRRGPPFVSCYSC